MQDYSELPSNLLLKKISPKILPPCLAALWGIIVMCLGFVRGFTGFWVVRALLGVAEGGLLPGMVLYLSGLYTRGGLALASCIPRRPRLALLEASLRVDHQQLDHGVALRVGDGFSSSRDLSYVPERFHSADE
ncbi:Major facilitator superfamily domain, general substrate transporter [Metarhizium album ARSEF 1941]|uniref:Major facilitator superfamily domain, general substrate transporter n=1 Tax=Metarhizium album (strain ARSEF 1941) TaxID=1081103 RepID=A0A0B2X5H8_METAS|nr:Major facilitator superfamily domain, general substrate transporter [Metarhizium album ARSEF 1941]KHO00566.1 Major facilitator superfamily domain, general substrate transporter [Metarhizium album ARSEF 1941]